VRSLREWAGGLVLLLLLAACSRPLTHAYELTPPALLSPDVLSPTPTWTMVPPPTSTPPPPVPTLPLLPTVVPHPTSVPPLTLLPTIVSQPAPDPTPFPDAQAIVDTVLGTGTSEHWANYLVSGSFTARGADERLALVGNIGDHNEVRWVVVGQVGDGWWLLGTSERLGSGFDASLSSYLPPDLLDFDGDGRREVLSHDSKTQGGWMISTDILYRWDGHTLASVWRASTGVDSTTAGGQDVPQPYRAEWEWVRSDGQDPGHIRLRERVVFFLPGEERGERIFRWDGEAFRPYAPNGPDSTFAYVASGDVWLWQNHTARPLGVENVREIQWSPDGLRIAWWAQSPLEVAARGAILGVYDLTTGARREFSLEGAPSALRPAPDGRLAYALPDQTPVLLDLETGQQAPLPVPSLGTWSPDGKRMAYEQDGNLYIYDLSTGQERSLVVAPAEGGPVALAILPDLAWSPRGDWIASYLSNPDFTWVGLVTPDLGTPVSAIDLLETFGGRKAPAIQVAWSPDGAHLAALATAPRPAQQLTDFQPGQTVLYLAKVPYRGNDPGGRPEWHETLHLETVTRTVRLAWSPDGERLMVAAGTEVWEATATGETTLRRRFSFPDLWWKTLEWAPDGSGVLVGLEGGYGGRLYWFPADGAEPVLLLAGSLGSAHWAPRTTGGRASRADRPPVALVEYAGYNTPRLHFVGGDGSDIVVRAKRANRCTPFQVGGQRVYYDTTYADQKRVVALRVPDAPAGCHPPLVSPDGKRLAWLCDDGTPALDALIDGTAEIHFWLIVTDGQGRDPREVWHHVETGPDYRGVHPMSWRADGTVVYLSRPRYGAAWAYFEYNPGILALDVNTGQSTQIGDPDGVYDGRVSPDGAWLAQSRIATWPNEGVTITLRSLVDGVERDIACAERSMVAGDFSFSPDNAWLAWRELATEPGGSELLVRALRLPAGEPLTVYEDAQDAAPRIGGWLRGDDLVLVYPMREDGTGGNSTVVTLPATGPGSPFSPFVFLGMLGEAP
jgi:hypothetical protein